MKKNIILKSLALIALIIGAISPVSAQTYHTMKAQFVGGAPAGPNTNFSVDLTMLPADINISGFGIRVYYDNTKIHLTGITNNTGQPGSSVLYDRGNETSQLIFQNTSVYMIVNMSTLYDLVTPTDLGRLNFTTTASYDPASELTIILSGQPPSSGGLSDSSIRYIPTKYEHIGESIVVPVSLSGFTLE